MTRKTKIALIILASILLAGAIGITIYYLANKNDSSEEEQEEETNPFVEPSPTHRPNQSGGTITTTPTPVPTVTNSNQVKPKFDSEGQLSNSWGEIKERMLYPKREWQGGWGYSNIRTDPEVDQGGWDGIDNLITTLSAGTPIGKAKELETRLYNDFPYKWFKVKLYKPVAGWFSDYTEGYVRSDTVTFVPYDR